MTENNEKLNIAQRYFIAESHLFFGHIPGLKWIDRVNCIGIRRRPKYMALTLIPSLILRVVYAVWAINWVNEHLTKKVEEPTEDELSFLEDYKVQAYEDTTLYVRNPEDS